MGYPVSKGPLPNMRRRCTNFSSVFPDFDLSITLFHCNNLHTQHGNQFHTNLSCGVEHGSRGLVWERKFLLNKSKRSVSVLQCHFGSLPKDRGGISVISFYLPDMWKASAAMPPSFIIWVTMSVAIVPQIQSFLAPIGKPTTPLAGCC